LSYLPKKLLPYKSIINNFTSLSVLQAANYIFPLIVLPYVVRVIGPANYGLINFAAAFVAYFNLVCEYGFGLSGTKEISINRDDEEKINRIFSNIITVKILLLIICFIVLVILLYTVDMFFANGNIFLLSYGLVIGFTLFPGWFFQGIEQMKYISIIQLIVRTVSTILIFLLINEEADYLLLVLLNAIAQIAIGIIGLFVAFYKFNIRYTLPAPAQIKKQLRSGWNIFQSMIAINLYTTSNIFILGLFASETVVGYFAAADKIRLAFQGVQSMLSQAVFPYVNDLINKSKKLFFGFIKKLIKLQIAIGFIISTFLFIYSTELTQIILGNEFNPAALLLRIISPLPFIIAISNILGIQIMLPLGLEKLFNRIISFSALIHLCVLMFMVPNYLAIGTSATVVFTEVIVSLLMFAFIWKKRILFELYEV